MWPAEPALLGAVGYWTIVVGLVAVALTLVAGMIDLWDVVADRTRRAAVTFNLVSGAAMSAWSGPAGRSAGRPAG